jgi:hypothetical protein
LSIGIEGRVDLLGTKSLDGVGSVQASVIMGLVVPCLRRPISTRFDLGVCLEFGAGAMQSTASGVTVSHPSTTFYSAIGLRPAIDLKLTQNFALRAQLDGLAVLTPTSLTILNQGVDVTVWVTPPVAVSGGLVLVGLF